MRQDVLLIGWSGGTTNQKNYPDLGSDTYQWDIFGACSSDVFSRGNQWWLVRARELPAREGMLLAAIRSSCDFALLPLISQEWRGSRANRDTHGWSPSSSVACLSGIERFREGVGSWRRGKGRGVWERGRDLFLFAFAFFLFSIFHFAPATQAYLSLVGGPVVCYTTVFSVVTQRFFPRGVLRDDTKNGCVAD